LHERSFAKAETSAVADVVDVIVSFGVFSVGATNLNVVLISDFLESLFVLAEMG